MSVSEFSNSKNITRLASILGTWTGQTHLKADIGSYELLAYFVIHLMPDPMRGYGCSLVGCSEEENQVCEIGQDGNGVCTNIADNVVDWSDVTAFIYFGARIDVGFPFNKHRAEDTGGWVGPLNIIFSKSDDVAEKDNHHHHHDHHDNTKNNDNSNSNNNHEEKDISDNNAVVVDRYISRYVKSPLTPFLRMPKNCTLLGADDFDKVAGTTAVEETTKGQYDPNRGENDDPYADHLQTCDNGDVKPLLPLFQFDFEEDESKNETVQVKLNYKFLTMPNHDDYMYNLYPMVQRKFNAANLGFHISGPYCYGNDPKRGYTFDMNFDTRDPKAMLKLSHGCVEGLPCTPPAADLYNAQDGSSIHVKPNVLPDNSTTVGVGKAFFLFIAIFVLTITLIRTCFVNHKLRGKLADSSSSNDEEGNSDDEQMDSEVDTPYEQLNDGGKEDTMVINDGEVTEPDVSATTPLIERDDDNDATSPGVV